MMIQIEISVKGCLDPVWGEWFEGLEVTTQDEDKTVLTGRVPDQSALYGILARLRDLGLELISVESTALEEGSL